LCCLNQAVDNRFKFLNPCPTTDDSQGRFTAYNGLVAAE
jgi:hypothetical protein